MELRPLVDERFHVNVHLVINLIRAVLTSDVSAVMTDDSLLCRGLTKEYREYGSSVAERFTYRDFES